LLEKYCPVCGELRPVRTERDDEGTKRYFCAKCQAPLGEEVADSFEKSEPDFPDA
jgi:transposase-like protein